CGLRYAVKRSGNAVGYCSLTIKCGTRDEGGFHSGIAHFTEHTLFKGTERKSARVISSYLDKLGGELNAFTTKEEIVLHSTVLKEDLGKAASLLLELATSPTFPEEEVSIEKGVVIDEINSYKDSPADDVYDKFEEALFEGHPLGRSILGTAASVKKITGKELKLFTKEHFVPANMALAIVADIDEKRMEENVLKLAGKVFTKVPMARGERVVTPIPLKPAFNRQVEKRNHEVNAVIGNFAPSLYDTEERFAAILMSNIIGGPASNSLLNSLLREKNGWVYGVESSYSQYTESGIMTISLGCERGNLEKCLDAIWKVIRKMQNEEYSSVRLKAAKKQILGQLAISSDNGEAQCLSMGKSLMSLGSIFTDRQNREAIEAVTSEGIRDAAVRIFNPESTSSLIFL
ncbi:MAG: pitrilysin family protein, partial [Bacteroidales bacterium]|nr:pitrilysin family protein [Bacteroidales bacterium]